MQRRKNIFKILQKTNLKTLNILNVYNQLISSKRVLSLETSNYPLCEKSFNLF